MPGIAAPPELEAAIEQFIDSLRREIRVEVVVLFGSYARGTPHYWSDIDVAVVSPDFEGVPLPERQSILSRLTWQTRDTRITPIAFPSSEYRDPPRASFLREILRTGRVVYEAPEGEAAG